MGVRRQTAEHPFGTIKCWMGATHFLTQKLPKVATEMALNVLAYNMTRVMNIVRDQAADRCDQPEAASDSNRRPFRTVFTRPRPEPGIDADRLSSCTGFVRALPRASVCADMPKRNRPTTTHG